MTKHWIQIFAVSAIVLFSKIVSAVPEGPPVPVEKGGTVADKVQTQEVAARNDSSPIVPTPLHRIGPYSEKKAVLLSALSTGLSIAVGGGLMMGGLLGRPGEQGWTGTDVSGLTWTGAGILAIGGAVAPSLGHFYAKNVLRGTLMTVFRTLLIGAAVIPQIAYHQIAYHATSADGEGLAYSVYVHLAFVVPLVSAAALGVAVADLLTVRRSVRKANAAYRRKMGISW